MQTLLTEFEYRSITNDTSTATSVVTARMENALDLIEEYLERSLESAEVTETLEVWYDDYIGYVYPMRTPVTDIPSGVGYVIDELDTRIRGVVADAITVVAWPTATPQFSAVDSLSPFSRNRPDYASVTYTGGYTNATLPYTLKVYIATLTYKLLRWSPASNIGATNVRVGDIQVQYPKAQAPLDALVPGMSLGLKPYRRKRVRY